MIGKKINQLATELAPVSTDLTIIGDPVSGVSKKITLAQLGAIFSGAVSFYTNLAAFPVVGDINVIYCAKDTQKLYLWSGSAYTEVFPSQALLDTYQLRSEKGVSNGYASLDSGGKVPISQLPSSIMEYKGTWNAATNTPTLANGTGDTGDVYICNVAGTVNFGAGAITFAVGDYVIYSGTIWQRSSGAVGTVTSVAVSRSGDALAITGSPITTSGTINIGFAGTGAQYIKGDGTLATFPNTISQAEKLITEVYNSTGATLTKGTIVYINGGQGNLPTVTKALATGDSTSAQTFGVVQADITNNNNGYVVVAGKLSDLDTQAYTEGTQLYLSATTAGTWTSTKQYAPNHLVYVGIVVRAHPTQGIVEVKIQNGYEMDELHNVAAQSPDNNDILQYKTATSLWTKVAGTTTNIAEGTNLYYTEARVNANTNVAANTAARHNAVTLGTANGLSLSTQVLSLALASGSTTGALSSTDWTTFNNKQNALTNPVTGTGTTNYLAKFTGSSTIGIGQVFDDGTSVLIGTTSSTPNVKVGIYSTTQRALEVVSTNSNALFVQSPAAFIATISNGTWVTNFTNTGRLDLAGDLLVNTIANATTDTDRFLVSDSGVIKYRTGAELLSDIGGQGSLTNPVTGTGTTNYLPKFTGTSTIGNSVIQEASNNIGIGHSPSYKFDINNVGGSSATARLYGNDQANVRLRLENTGGRTWELTGGLTGANNSTFTIYDVTAAATRLQIDASGNLGLGVTPSAWSVVGPVLQINRASFYGYENQARVGANGYFDGSSFKYIATDFATEYRQNSGQHFWLTAPSGTAGNAISFTQAMTLDASGNLGVGATSVNSRLQVTAAAGLSHARWTESATTVGFVGGAQGIITGHNGKFAVRGESGLVLSGQGNSADMIIASTGAATFSSSVTAGSLTVGSLGSGSDAIISLATNASGSPRTIYYKASTAAINFTGTGGSDLMTLTNGGNVGIGTTSPAYRLVVNSATDGISAGVSGSTYGIRFDNGGTFSSGMSTIHGVDATLTGSYQPIMLNGSDVRFGTSATERMRITSGGSLLVGTTSELQSATSKLNIAGDFYNANGVSLKTTNGGSGSQFVGFINESGTLIGSINRVTTTNAVAYNTTSDYRLKEDLKSINGLEIVNKIKVYDYKWKSDNSRMDGVLAHELAEVLPYAVTGIKDGEKMQQVDYSKIVPVLIQSVKELKAELDTLKNK